MSGHDYLAGVLEKQALTSDELDSLRGLRDTIEKALRDDFGSTPRIYYAGSFGKKTMIRLSYDLDIVFYYPHDANTTVKEIRADVKRALTDRPWAVADKDVSLRLYPEGGGFHIDVVPGRAIDDSFHHATLYRSTEDTTLQTSVKIHIESVSDRRDLVKLVKLWKVRHGLTVRTFLLEQATMRAASGCSLTDLQKQMLAVLTWFRDDFTGARIEDPANSNNVISDLATAYEKLLVASQAGSSLKEDYWSKIVW